MRHPSYVDYLDARFPWHRSYFRVWTRNQRPVGTVHVNWNYKRDRWHVLDIGTPFMESQDMVIEMDRYYVARLPWKSFDKKSADCLAMRMWRKTVGGGRP